MKFITLNPAPWATNANYPAGAFPWSGTPTRINPGSPYLAAGAIPGGQAPAQVTNYQFGAVGDSLAAQAQLATHAALQEWSSISLPILGADTYSSIVGERLVRSYSVTNDTQRQVIAVGIDAGTSNRVRICHCADGSAPEPVPARLDSIASFTGAPFAAAGKAGELILTNGGVQFAYTTDSTSSWHVSSGFTGPPNILRAHYDATLGVYLMITTGTTNCYRAASIATMLSSPSTSSIATPASSIFVSVEIASNGINIVLAGTTAAGVAQLYISTDSGASWATALSLGASTHGCNIAYSEYWNVFIAWADTGEIYTSGDGSAWAQVASGLTAANGFAGGSMAVAGPALAKPTLNSTVYGDSLGVVYSLDLGASWNWHYFNTKNSVGNTVTLRGINNRIYATAVNTLWRSGILAMPSAER